MKYLPLALILAFSCTITWSTGSIQFQNDTSITIDSVSYGSTNFDTPVGPCSQSVTYAFDSFGEKYITITTKELGVYTFYLPLNTEIRGRYVVRIYGPVFGVEGDPRIYAEFKSI